MYVRKIKPEEYPRTEDLFCIAFEFPWQEKKPEAGALLERVANRPANRIELNFKERWAAFDEQENMMAFLSAPPYPIRFDGNDVVMSAVGGVSTLPQYRKCGAMRGCFEKALQDMYDEGRELSYLYPFSQVYYRKYGYELCGQKVRYELDLRALPNTKQRGDAVLLEKGNVAKAVAEIYRLFAERYNLAVNRTEIDYKWAENADPSQDGRYVYVCYDEKEEPCAVVDFAKAKEGGRFIMECSHFWFLGEKGIREALAFMRSFGNYYERAVFTLPSDIELSAYVPEWSLYPTSRELKYMGMARVIRVDKILEQARYIGAGKFGLQIEDKILSGNNGCFMVEFKEGHAVSVEMAETQKTEAADVPFLKLSIGTFSRWILEGCPQRRLLETESVTEANIALWSRVFQEKSVWLDDAF